MTKKPTLVAIALLLLFTPNLTTAQTKNQSYTMWELVPDEVLFRVFEHVPRDNNIKIQLDVRGKSKRVVQRVYCIKPTPQEPPWVCDYGWKSTKDGKSKLPVGLVPELTNWMRYTAGGTCKGAKLPTTKTDLIKWYAMPFYKNNKITNPIHNQYLKDLLDYYAKETGTDLPKN